MPKTDFKCSDGITKPIDVKFWRFGRWTDHGPRSVNAALSERVLIPRSLSRPRTISGPRHRGHRQFSENGSFLLVVAGLVDVSF